MDNRPIGIFDSGLGGLTALSALQQFLPNEDFVFFGDTANIPYGVKDYDTINNLAEADIQFLLSQNVKLIIAACGTVSSNLSEKTINSLPVPLFTIIEPAVQAAIKASKNGKIGVLGTSATIRSDAFHREIQKTDSSITVIQQECPLFVRLVESGLTSPDDLLTRVVAEDYLSDIRNAGCDVIILGCTHFPHLTEVIRSVVGSAPILIDSGREAAASAASYLYQHRLLSDDGAGYARYYVSGDPIRFSLLASKFLNSDLTDSVISTKDLLIEQVLNFNE